MSEGKHGLVIATWGYPGNWKRVTYRRGSSERKEVNKILEKLEPERFSFTSLSMFGDWEKSILISITLADKQATEIGPKDAIEKLRELADKLASEGDCKDPLIEELMNESRVEVLAGAGSFQTNKVLTTFKVPPQNINATILLKVFKILKDTNKDLIVLDVTHGLNYHPILVKEILSNTLIPLYSLMIEKDVVFAIGASDPVTGRFKCDKDVTLTYNIFAVTKYTPDMLSIIDMINMVENRFLKSPIKGKLDEFNAIKGDLNDLGKDITLVSYFPSPLYWSYLFTKLCVKKETLLSKLDKLIKIVENALDSYIVHGDIVESKVTAEDDTIRELLIMYVILSKVRKRGEMDGAFFKVTHKELKELENLLRGRDLRVWQYEYSSLTKSLREVEEHELLERRAKIKEDIEKAKSILRNKLTEYCIKNEELRKRLLKIDDPTSVIDGLNTLEKVLDEALPYSFLSARKEEDFVEGALWWSYAYYVLTNPKGDKNERLRYVRHFIAHGGLLKEVTLIFSEESIGYYIPMLRGLEETAKKDV